MLLYWLPRPLPDTLTPLNNVYSYCCKEWKKLKCLNQQSLKISKFFSGYSKLYKCGINLGLYIRANAKQTVQNQLVAINVAEAGDPGEKARGEIFSISCKKDDIDGFYDFLNKYPRYQCQKSFETKTVSSLKKYIETRGSSNEYRHSNSIGFSGGLWGVNLETNAAF